MSHPNVRPLPFPRAILVFAGSAVPFWLGLWVVLPLLVRRGVATPIALSVSLLTPLGLLLAAALLSRRWNRDRVKVSWRERWRLEALRPSHLGWAILLFAVSLIGYVGLEGTTEWLRSGLGWAPPPELDLAQTEETFWGLTLAGNPWVLLVHAGILVLNVLAEELWFRGVLFPRQEAAHGRSSWWIHGLCYHAFHMFYPWSLLRLLPESLMYGFVAWRSRSTWPGLISHFLFNGLGLLATAQAVWASG